MKSREFGFGVHTHPHFKAFRFKTRLLADKPIIVLVAILVFQAADGTDGAYFQLQTEGHGVSKTTAIAKVGTYAHVLNVAPQGDIAVGKSHVFALIVGSYTGYGFHTDGEGMEMTDSGCCEAGAKKCFFFEASSPRVT